jgi:hypothetical protein
VVRCLNEDELYVICIDESNEIDRVVVVVMVLVRWNPGVRGDSRQWVVGDAAESNSSAQRGGREETGNSLSHADNGPNGNTDTQQRERERWSDIDLQLQL